MKKIKGQLVVPFEIKQMIDEEEGDSKRFVIEGYASTFGNVDRGYDMVMPGAFANSISEFKRGEKQVPVLYQHNMRNPIGRIREMREDNKGLYIKAAMPLDMMQVREEIAPLMRDNVLNAMSIGYFTDRYEKDDVEGIRKLLEIDLYEVSIVTLPMNPEAMVTSVKAAELGEMQERELERAFRDGTSFSQSAAKELVKYVKIGRRESDADLAREAKEHASQRSIMDDVHKLLGV